MKCSFPRFLAAFVVVLSLAAGEEDNPHLGQNRPAETILSEKGLTLDGSGCFFVLRAQDDELLSLRQIAHEGDRLKDDVSRAEAALREEGSSVAGREARSEARIHW
jgi:hypothetical protein